MQADKDKINRLLKTAKGQIEGIMKMVEDDRYCIDISTQLMACSSVLQRANKEILSAHLKACVAHAKDEDEINKKVDEFMKSMDKLM